MKKIRINELARELEVKPNKILELLPDLGVQEKKTHSSSIDEDVAIQIKQRFVQEGLIGSNGDGYGADDHDDDRHVQHGHVEAPGAEAHVRPPAPEAAPETTAPAEVAKTAEASAPAAEEHTQTARASTFPLRPPLTSHRDPLSPPMTAHVTPPVAHPAQPGVHQPGVHQGVVRPPQAPPPVHAAPGAPAPPKPAPQQPSAPQRPAAAQPGAPPRNQPIYRPGQVLSGPRQPLPPGIGTEARTVPSAGPGLPRQAAPSSPGVPQRPSAPRLPSSPPPGIAVPRSSPQQMRTGPGAPQQAPPSQPQQGRPALAGQPAARPIVPPRPELMARIQNRPLPGQAQPAQPRPGIPTRPPSSPVPGQPIYRGPIRPGQPLMRGPGAPAPGGPQGYQNRGPGGPRTGRPLHPTSPMRIEPSTPPPTDTRRQAFRPGQRPGGDRKRDMEGKIRQAPIRREQPAPPPPIDREITIGEGITVKELSEKLGIKSNLVIKKLVERKIFATINQSLDIKLAEDISREFGASTNKLSYEEEASWEIELAEDEKDLVSRAPVVTIMGHVDHGKTSLLDAIRTANVAGREAGGITQHIGAYQVEKNGRKIAFIDTPGHEAFTRMRARGAKVTDIVVLVVAADDGVMPQTLEAIDHARAAKVPILVAINKIDKPDAQPERIKQQLADRGLLAEDWGGDVVMVPVSAKAQTNLDLLLEMILIMADLGNYKANLVRPAVGTVLEAQLDKGRGPVATVLVQNGILRIGDFFICGQVFGKVRAMYDENRQQVKEATPSTPVEVLGLDGLPEVGDAFQVVIDTTKAKQIVMYRETKAREQAMSKGARVTLEQFHEQVKEGDVKELNLIIKSDVGGTAEVLSDMLQKLSNEKVKIRILSKNVGAITESDVLLASASEAIIIGFNVKPDRTASAVADKEKVDIRLHSIIYELTDEIKKAMSGMLDPVFKEVFKGRAEVRDVFKITKVGNVAGCLVTEGSLTRNSLVRVTRDRSVVHTGKIESLKRFKDDVSEVKAGFECGVTIQNYADLKAGDILDAYVLERMAAIVF